MEISSCFKLAEEIVKKSGSSFYWGMRILPKNKRMAMYALYAFCREIDDIVDEPDKIENKFKRLDEWRAELELIYKQNHFSKPLGEALLKTITEYHLDKKEFDLLIDGVAMDLPTPICAPELNKYFSYCRGVAGAPGMLSLRIFGIYNDNVKAFAISLGDALQTTNILRDMYEDAQIGRLYAPKEILEKHGVSTKFPQDAINHPKIALVRTDLAKIAAQKFEEAEQHINLANMKLLRPALIMMNLYKLYFDAMKKRGWAILYPRPYISKFQKIAAIFKAFY